MGISAVRLAANRANALKSCGPKTVAGKDASRRNALKHGLTGQGIVIPGEDANELAERIAALEPELASTEDVMARLLVRQVAVLTIRHERAYRYETAVVAERMRRATADHDDARQAVAEQLLDRIAIEPATTHRRLMSTIEGVDCLLGRLRALREAAAMPSFVAWTENDGFELNLCMGHKIGGAPSTRAYCLTQAVLFNNWSGIDPAEWAGRDERGQVAWALAELVAVITVEVARLEAHRATLDPAEVAQSRAEASERALVDPGPNGLILRRYQNATERSMLKILRELRVMRYEAQCRAVEPAQVVEALDDLATEMPELQDVAADLASFFPPPSSPTQSRVAVSPGLGWTTRDAGFVPITIGRPPATRPRSGP